MSTKNFYSVDQIKKIYAETEHSLPRPKAPPNLPPKYNLFSDGATPIPGLEPLPKFDAGDFYFHTFASRPSDAAEPLQKWFYSYGAGAKEYGPYDRNTMANMYERLVFDSGVLVRDSRNFYFTSLRDMVERQWKSFFKKNPTLSELDDHDAKYKEAKREKTETIKKRISVEKYKIKNDKIVPKTETSPEILENFPSPNDETSRREQGWLFQWPSDHPPYVLPSPHHPPAPFPNHVPFLPPAFHWPIPPSGPQFFPPQMPTNFPAPAAPRRNPSAARSEKGTGPKQAPQTAKNPEKEPKMGKRLRNWCRTSLKELNWAEKWPVLEDCFRAETSAEVKRRVVAEYGDSAEARAFAEQFYKQREFYRDQNPQNTAVVQKRVKNANKKIANTGVVPAEKKKSRKKVLGATSKV